MFFVGFYVFSYAYFGITQRSEPFIIILPSSIPKIDKAFELTDINL
jgi:hypothetical protein